MKCENKVHTDDGEWYCPKCAAYLDPAQVTYHENCAICGTPVSVDDTKFCGKPAVIRYDGRNLCAECADESVLALLRAADSVHRGASGNGWMLTTSQDNTLRDSVAALAPKEDS